MAIYFISNNESIKIGRSKDIDRRKDQLQTGNSNELQILYVIEDIDDSFETHIHSICINYRIKGEWFKKEVLNHLLNHPWYKEKMKPYSVK